MGGINCCTLRAFMYCQLGPRSSAAAARPAAPAPARTFSRKRLGGKVDVGDGHHAPMAKFTSREAKRAASHPIPNTKPPSKEKAVKEETLIVDLLKATAAETTAADTTAADTTAADTTTVEKAVRKNIIAEEQGSPVSEVKIQSAVEPADMIEGDELEESEDRNSEEDNSVFHYPFSQEECLTFTDVHFPQGSTIASLSTPEFAHLRHIPAAIWAKLFFPAMVLDSGKKAVRREIGERLLVSGKPQKQAAGAAFLLGEIAVPGWPQFDDVTWKDYVVSWLQQDGYTFADGRIPPKLIPIVKANLRYLFGVEDHMSMAGNGFGMGKPDYQGGNGCPLHMPTE